MFLERLDVLMRLFAETEPFDHDGDGFTLRSAVLQLRPRSRPHPEIAIVTGSNRESLRRIGRYGARWLVGAPPDRFEQAWAEIEAGARDAGREARRSDAVLPVTVHLADSKERALDEVREGAARERFDFQVPVTGASVPDVPRERWVEHLDRRPTVVIGTPDEATEAIDALRRATGIGGVLLTVKRWASPEATARSFDAFARHVAAALQGSTVGLASAERAATEMMRTVSAGEGPSSGSSSASR